MLNETTGTVSNKMNKIGILLTLVLAFAISSCSEHNAKADTDSADHAIDVAEYNAPSEDELEAILQEGMSIDEAREKLGPETFSEANDSRHTLDWIWDDGTKSPQPGDLVGVTLYFVDGRLDGWISSKLRAVTRGSVSPSAKEEN